MKTYIEFSNEIEMMLESKDYLEICKYESEIEILDSYINNQLYLREYTDNYVLNNSKIEMILEDATNKHQAWYTKVVNFTMDLVNKVWSFIVGIFRWIRTAVSKLLSFISKQDVTKELQNVRTQLTGTRSVPGKTPISQTPEIGEQSTNSLSNQSINASTYVGINGDLYTEKANQEILNVILHNFSKTHDHFAKIYKPFMTKMYKMKTGKLTISVNGNTLESLFNNKNQEADIVKLVSQDTLEFTFNWDEQNEQNKNNRFVMTSIENFNKITNEVVEYINAASTEVEKGINFCIQCTQVVVKMTMGDFNNNNSDAFINDKGNIDAINKFIDSLIQTGIMSILSYLNMNQNASIVKGFATNSAKAARIFFKSIFKSIANHKSYDELFTNTLTFNVSNLLKPIQENSTKVNNVFTTQVQVKEKMLENFINQYKSILIKGAEGFFAKIKEKTAKAAHTYTHAVSGIMMTMNITSKQLQEFNDSSDIARVSEWLKKYGDLNVNMMTIVTFAANCQNLILNALKINPTQ